MDVRIVGLALSWSASRGATLRRSLFIAIAAAGLLIAGLGAGFHRVVQLEGNELLHESQTSTLAELQKGPDSTRVSARLTANDLEAGEQAFFEICSQDGLPPDRWQDALELVVWRVKAKGLQPVMRVPLDRARLDGASRGSEGACLQLGGIRVADSSRYALDAVWLQGRPSAAVMDARLYVRVIARTPLEWLDRLFVASIALGAFIALSVLFFTPASRSRSGIPRAEPAQSPEAPDTAPGGEEGTTSSQRESGLPTRPRAGLGTALIGVGATAAVWAAVTWLPLWGSSLGLLKGLIVLAAEIGAALFLASRLGSSADRLTVLGLRAPARSRWLWLLASGLCAPALVAAARISLALVPATGEAPIQTFVSWPSGMLSFAVLGVVVPVGEEVFFRGFVYRAALGLGRVAAFAITVVLFVAMHAQQSWGNWGGLVALLVTGTALTGLRVASGSALVPAFCHLLYNLLLSLPSL